MIPRQEPRELPCSTSTMRVQVVGISPGCTSGVGNFGFVYTNGSFTNYGPNDFPSEPFPPSGPTQPQNNVIFSINNSGQFVGSYSYPFVVQAFLGSGGTITALFPSHKLLGRQDQ